MEVTATTLVDVSSATVVCVDATVVAGEVEPLSFVVVTVVGSVVVVVDFVEPEFDFGTVVVDDFGAVVVVGVTSGNFSTTEDQLAGITNCTVEVTVRLFAPVPTTTNLYEPAGNVALNFAARLNVPAAPIVRDANDFCTVFVPIVATNVTVAVEPTFKFDAAIDITLLVGTICASTATLIVTTPAGFRTGAGAGTGFGAAGVGAGAGAGGTGVGVTPVVTRVSAQGLSPTTVYTLMRKAYDVPSCNPVKFTDVVVAKPASLSAVLRTTPPADANDAPMEFNDCVCAEAS